MTDQDELRDRIAATMDRNFNPDQYPIMSSMFRDYAQAVIDEFGLHYVDSEEYAHAGLGWIEVEKGRHVVGKWEKQ